MLLEPNEAIALFEVFGTVIEHSESIALIHVVLKTLPSVSSIRQDECRELFCKRIVSTNYSSRGTFAMTTQKLDFLNSKGVILWDALPRWGIKELLSRYKDKRGGGLVGRY